MNISSSDNHVLISWVYVIRTFRSIVTVAWVHIIMCGGNLKEGDTQVCIYQESSKQHI